MNDFRNLKPVSSYSIRQAGDDGFLIQVDQRICTEAGIRHPV